MSPDAQERKRDHYDRLTRAELQEHLDVCDAYYDDLCDRFGRERHVERIVELVALTRDCRWEWRELRERITRLHRAGALSDTTCADLHGSGWEE